MPFFFGVGGVHFKRRPIHNRNSPRQSCPFLSNRPFSTVPRQLWFLEDKKTRTTTKSTTTTIGDKELLAATTSSTLAKKRQLTRWKLQVGKTTISRVSTFTSVDVLPRIVDAPRFLFFHHISCAKSPQVPALHQPLGSILSRVTEILVDVADFDWWRFILVNYKDFLSAIFPMFLWLPPYET